MAITNEQYQEALELIASKDSESVKAALGITLQICADLKSATEKMEALTSTLPVVTKQVSLSTSRSSIQNLVSQIQSFSQQMGYTKNSFETVLAQYEGERAI